MGTISWVKLDVKMFDDEKIKAIRSMPSGSELCLIWIQLIALAGKTNDRGQIYLSEDIPYTEGILANSIGHSTVVVHLALETFKKLGMITLLANDRIALLNWEKHQNVEGLDRFKELNRQRTENYRKRLEAVGGDSYRRHTSMVMARDGNRCVYCGSEENLVLDHLIPLLKGGDNEPDNLVAACRKCNAGKAGKTLEESGYTFIDPETEKVYDALKSRRHAVTLRDHIDIDSEVEQEKKERPCTPCIPSVKNDTRLEQKTERASLVLLTDSEMDKLEKEYGVKNTQAAIKKLSAFKLSKGKRYKSDYGAILSWAMRSVLEKGAVPDPTTGSRREVEVIDQEYFERTGKFRTKREER